MFILGHELGQTSGDGEGQGVLVCYSSWSHKELNPTGQLNSDNNHVRSFYLLYHVKPALTRSSLNVCVCVCVCVCVKKSFSHVQLFACQAPQSMGFSRQDYWSGLPFTSPRDLPKPGIKPRSPTLQADSLPSEPPGKPTKYTPVIKIQQENRGPRTFKGSLFSYFLYLLAFLYSNYPWIYIKRLCIQLDYTVSTCVHGSKGNTNFFQKKIVFTLH